MSASAGGTYFRHGNEIVRDETRSHVRMAAQAAYEAMDEIVGGRGR